MNSVTEDCILPLSMPMTGTDGRRVEAIAVPKGTEVYIAIAAANHNKAIWGPDALEFKPERWQNGRAQGVTVRMSGVYGNTMTFVGGGRSCMCVVCLHFTLEFLFIHFSVGSSSSNSS